MYIGRTELGRMTSEVLRLEQSIRSMPCGRNALEDSLVEIKYILKSVYKKENETLFKNGMDRITVDKRL